MLADITVTQGLVILGEITCLATGFAAIVTAVQARKSLVSLVQTFFYAFLAALIIMLFIAVLWYGWNDPSLPSADEVYRF